MSLPSPRFVAWHCEPDWAAEGRDRWWSQRLGWVVVDLHERRIVWRPEYSTRHEGCAACHRAAERLNRPGQAGNEPG